MFCLSHPFLSHLDVLLVQIILSWSNTIINTTKLLQASLVFLAERKNTKIYIPVCNYIINIDFSQELVVGLGNSWRRHRRSAQGLDCLFCHSWSFSMKTALVPWISKNSLAARSPISLTYLLASALHSSSSTKRSF